MDTTGQFDLEFLDLTGVDEYERNNILSSLQPLQPNGTFPWFIGNGKDTNALPPNPATNKPNYSLPITKPAPENGLVVPVKTKPSVPNGPEAHYCANQQLYTPPGVPANFGSYLPEIPANSNIYPPFIPPIPPIYHYYNAPTPAPFVVAQPSSVARRCYVDEQNIPLKKTASPLSAESPAFTPKENTKPTSLEVLKPVPEVPNCQAEVPKQASAWGAGKSWASLFTPKEGAVAGGEVNGLMRSPFPEAVTKESNNNDCPIKNPRKSHFIDPDCYRMGEFLIKYGVDGRAVSLQPRGLINQSTYCYINSILQALIACPPMYNLLCGLAENISSNAKRKPTPVIDGMCKFVKEYKHLPANMRVSNRRSEGAKKDPKKDQGAMINTDIPFEPAWIYKMLHGLQTDLMEGRQEDAEEFLGCLLNSLSDEMSELIKLVGTTEKPSVQDGDDDGDTWQVMGTKNKGSVLRKTEFSKTPITDIFGGSLKSKINRIGGVVTENTQPFLTLPLNIEKVKTVREALEALTTKYQLEGLTSAKTNEEVEAWQQVMLDELPIVLVLHLKCFDYKLDGCTKIVKALEFPIDLKIDSKLLSSTKTTNAKEKQYKLFAVVYHDGKDATKGHYITDAFHVGYSSWLRYDDASVKPVQEEQVLNPQGTRVPYLLFYRRSDTIRGR